jgi:diguanylate cyclase (GGDEF)-like protein
LDGQRLELGRLGRRLTTESTQVMRRHAPDRGVAASILVRLKLVFAGPPRIWLVIIGLAWAAAAIYLIGLSDLPAIDHPVDVEWWAVAGGFVIVEILVVHLQFRRDTHSFSLSEIPLVIGLFFLRPSLLLLALLVGSGCALAFHRRQRPIKLAFNLANLAFTTGLAILLFRVILENGEPIGPAGWIAAFVATMCADLVTLVMITGVISLAAGKPPDLTQLLGSGSVATFFNTCLALVTVTVLWIEPRAVWLPLILAGLMFGAYRIYGSVRQKHESLEMLYESTRLLQASSDTTDAISRLLSQAREMFRAEHAEILFLPTATDAGLLAVQGEGADTTIDSFASLDPTEGIWARVASEGRGVALPRPIANERLREHFAARGIRDAIVAPLFGQDAVVGTMLVGNRVSDVATFTAEDLKLFETFANQASASLENARLIDRLRRHAEQTEHEALHDALTGLPNRSFFRQQVEAAAHTRAVQTTAAVLLMDLDRFKEVNDTLGHHNGDLLLQAVAARLRGVVRPGDVVARLGGDEFGILLVGAPDRDTADSLASRVVDAFTAPFVVHDLTLEVGASIGIAMYPDDGQDVDTLVQRADVAMYQAKNTLKGHEFYSAENDSYSPSRLVLLGELRGAIDGGDLTVAYQPKVDIATGRIIGAEALVRWLHPKRGFIPPDEFIPVAEHTGLLRPLTLYVLAAALEECARWRTAGFDIGIAVNLSVRNLLDVELPDVVAQLLREWSLPPSALELEITESALIADPARTNSVLRQLNEIGVGISIDDFGTGYSSLSYLRQMPVDEIKIDKSFVTDMAVDENDALIVRSTIDLGRNLGLRVVAEGVETTEVWEELSRLGCHTAQGYLFGRPTSGDDFLELLRSGLTVSANSDAEAPGVSHHGYRRFRVLRPTGTA